MFQSSKLAMIWKFGTCQAGQISDQPTKSFEAESQYYVLGTVSQKALAIYPPRSLLGAFLVPSFFPSSLIARIAIAIGSITFNRNVPVNAATNDS